MSIKTGLIALALALGFIGPKAEAQTVQSGAEKPVTYVLNNSAQLRADALENMKEVINALKVTHGTRSYVELYQSTAGTDARPTGAMDITLFFRNRAQLFGGYPEETKFLGALKELAQTEARALGRVLNGPNVEGHMVPAASTLTLVGLTFPALNQTLEISGGKPISLEEFLKTYSKTGRGKEGKHLAEARQALEEKTEAPNNPDRNKAFLIRVGNPFSSDAPGVYFSYDGRTSVIIVLNGILTEKPAALISGTRAETGRNGLSGGPGG